MIVHGNQATLFGHCTFLPFPTASLLSLVCSHLTWTLLHEGPCEALKAWHIFLFCPLGQAEHRGSCMLPVTSGSCSSGTWRSPKPLRIHFRSTPCHHSRKVVLLSKGKLAITCRKRGCIEMRQTLTCGFALNQLHF